MSNKVKFLAYYLPQYHQIPENDEWWGEGFTEWTNVKKAKPLFRGHQQPIVPGELGYYDLLKTEGIQEKQAKLAKEYGIDGFIYYQYWFGGGKMLLEKPAEKMLANKKVDLPFCFCWANETWSGIWHGLTDKILAEQQYLGEEDEQAHFDYLLPFFLDDRYIKIEGKPLFVIYDINIPDIENYIIRIKQRAIKSGLKGLYIMCSNKAYDSHDFAKLGFDAKMSYAFNNEFKEIIPNKRKEFWTRIKNKIAITSGREYNPLFKTDYGKLHSNIHFKQTNVDTYPMVLPNWDNSPRSGRNGIIITNSSPINFKKELDKAVQFLFKNNTKEKIIILKSWNEWAEGNYLEPDSKNKDYFLKIIKEISEK